jgi:phosphoribosylanthranilate isomerase
VSRPRIKICCIKSVDEAKLAIHHGADALGLVSHMPTGPGVIDEKTIKHIAGTIPPAIASFLLTSQPDPEKIIVQQNYCGTNTLQLVDTLSKEGLIALREALPGISLVQVIHVSGQESLHKAMEYTGFVDALLLDSGNPEANVKELGGTGRVHNWEISREICRKSTLPVFLAGGINSENAREAINFVKPFGLDLCSGVRMNDKLDKTKLNAFFSSIM